MGTAIKIEEIYEEEMLLARVLRKNSNFPPGLSFLSDEGDPIQVGVWNHSVGTILQPHIHNIYEKVTNRTCEVLIVSTGSIHVDIYGYSESLVTEFTLSSGECGERIVGPKEIMSQFGYTLPNKPHSKPA